MAAMSLVKLVVLCGHENNSLHFARLPDVDRDHVFVTLFRGVMYIMIWAIPETMSMLKVMNN